jgi:hypothetical protein
VHDVHAFGAPGRVSGDDDVCAPYAEAAVLTLARAAEELALLQTQRPV